MAKTVAKKAKAQEKSLPHMWRTLILLLIIFILGNICFQSFNLVFTDIGRSVGAPSAAALITAIPGIVLGIVCFIYSSLGDFVSLKKITAVGAALIFIGSLAGFFYNFGTLAMVVIARAIQTAGCQVTGSVFLVLASKYCQGKQKVMAFGIFTAGYQLSTAIGILAGGLFTSLTGLDIVLGSVSIYGWSFLFLVPVLSIFCFPFIFPGLPENQKKKVHVDVWGFTIFGIAIGCLTVFFTCLGSSDEILHATTWIWICVALVFFIAFAIYINKAKHPFITPAFLKNTRWLKSIGLFAIFYFINFSVAPTFNNLGAQVFGITTGEVSLYLVWGYIVAVIVALLSGQIDSMLGRRATIIVAACLMAVGFALCGWFTTENMVFSGIGSMPVLALCNCFIWAGVGLIYSPVVDTVVGTVKPAEAGRAIGSNDLILNVSGSIGVAIFGPLMVGALWDPTFASRFSPAALADILPNLASPANAPAFSLLFFIYAGVALLGLIWYLYIMNSVSPVKTRKA